MRPAFCALAIGSGGGGPCGLRLTRICGACAKIQSGVKYLNQKFADNENINVFMLIDQSLRKNQIDFLWFHGLQFLPQFRNESAAQ